MGSLPHCKRPPLLFGRSLICRNRQEHVPSPSFPPFARSSWGNLSTRFGARDGAADTAVDHLGKVQWPKMVGCRGVKDDDGKACNPPERRVRSGFRTVVQQKSVFGFSSYDLLISYAKKFSDVLHL